MWERRSGIRCWVVMAGVALMTLSARESSADIVHGHVSGGGFKAGEKFTVTGKDKKAITVGTDKDGDYSVVLKPGTYVVTITHGTATFQATIVADAEPVRADIVFRPKPH